MQIDVNVINNIIVMQIDVNYTADTNCRLFHLRLL